MKTNKFLLGILAAGAMFASCSNELPGNEQPENGGKAEKSFMSVAIKQANSSTRSVTNGDGSTEYVQGYEKENMIKNISFFFFKANGEPFDLGSGIVSAPAGEEAEGDAPNGDNAINEEAEYYQNRYTITSLSTTNQNTNIDEEVDVMMVIEHNVGNIPAKIVAVLNYEDSKFTDLQNVGITDLKKKLLESALGNEAFVMSNSAYEDATGSVMETPIAAENLGKTAQEAKDNPVDIYVERVVARVDVKAAFTTTPNSKGAYPVGKTIKFSDASEAEVHAQILGWDINTYATKTNLIKDIQNTSWDTDFANWIKSWNDAANFRSYWANMCVGFDKTSDITKEFTWTSLNGTVNPVGSTDYCYENTTSPTCEKVDGVYNRVESRKYNTKVLVKAQIQDKSGNILRFANWYGQNYKANSENDYSDFKKVVANSLKNKLVKENGGTYTPIEAADIELRQGTGTGDEDSYKVYFVFSAAGEAATWYYLDDDNTYKAYPTATGTGTAAEVLYATEPARIWNGMAYYFVNIEHLGAKNDDDQLSVNNYVKGFYGVVRNHAYELTLTGISGLGTPVYDADETIPYPVEPDLTESFIAAKIKVLAWKWIKKEVILGK